MCLVRIPEDSLSSVLLMIGILYNAVYSMTMPELSQAKVSEIVKRHKLYLLCNFVAPKTIEMLVAYSREQATKGRELNLNDIIRFVNKCEAVLPDCTLKQQYKMPTDGAILDQTNSGSIHLNTFSKIEPNLALGVFSTKMDQNEQLLESNYANSQKPYNYRRNYNTSSSGYDRSNTTPPGYNRSNTTPHNEGGRSSRPQQRYGNCSNSYGSWRRFSPGKRRQSNHGTDKRSPNRSQSSHNRPQKINNRSQSPDNRTHSRSPNRYGNGKSPRRNSDRYSNYYAENLPRSPLPPRSPSRSRSPSEDRNCVRCNGSHLSSECRNYPEFCKTFCRYCNLSHRSQLCKTRNVKSSNFSFLQPEEVPQDGVEFENTQENVNLYDLLI